VIVEWEYKGAISVLDPSTQDMEFSLSEMIVKTFGFAVPNATGTLKLSTIPENSHGQKLHVNFTINKS